MAASRLQAGEGDGGSKSPPEPWPDYSRTAEALKAWEAAVVEEGHDDTARSPRLFDLERALMGAFGEDRGKPMPLTIPPAERLRHVRAVVAEWGNAHEPEAEALYQETMRALDEFLALDLEPMLDGKNDEALMEALVPVKDLVNRPGYTAVYKRVIPSERFKEFTQAVKADLLRLATGIEADARWAAARERRKEKGL